MLTAAFCLVVQGAAKKEPRKIFCRLLSNSLEFQSEILPTYIVILYARNNLNSI